MCRAEGMGIIPWGVLGSGKYKTEAEIAARGPAALRYGSAQSPAEKSMSAALARVAEEVGGGATLGGVAVAWAMQKTPYVFPVLGGRKPEQLLELIQVCPLFESWSSCAWGMLIPLAHPCRVCRSRSPQSRWRRLRRRRRSSGASRTTCGSAATRL